jgi:pimeloyl-ACP methyl ester carboxylesterase
MLRVLQGGAGLIALLALANAAPAKSRFTRLDGHRVHYTQDGKGRDTVLLIHGWTCDSTFWEKQIPSFSERHRVIAVDLPGHGRSDKPAIEYTPELFARAVSAVLEDAGADRAVLIGHSMGGVVARAVLARHPDRVRALVLVDSPMLPELKDAQAAAQRDLQVAAFVKSIVESAEPLKAREAMINGMFARNTPLALKEKVLRTMLAAPQPVAASAMRNMVPGMHWKAESSPVPVLMVVKKSPEAEANKVFLEPLLPNLRFEAWDGVGHFLMMEEPERFNALIRSFLAGLAARR